jgi:hypothetical protein
MKRDLTNISSLRDFSELGLKEPMEKDLKGAILNGRNFKITKRCGES